MFDLYHKRDHRYQPREEHYDVHYYKQSGNNTDHNVAVEDI